MTSFNSLAAFENAWRAFTEDFLAPRQDAWESSGRYPLEDIYREMGGQGLLRATLPVAHGGDGRPAAWDFRGLEILASSGCGAIGMSVATHQQITVPLMLRFGRAAVIGGWMRSAGEGGAIFGLALSEAQAGSDLAAMQTAYRRDGDGFLIDGAKRYVTNGGSAHALCVLARDAGHTGSAVPRATLFLVPMDSPGLTRTPLATMGNRGITAEVALEGVRVPASHALGGEGQGYFIQLSQFPRERLVISVRAAAISRRQLRLALDHCRSRTAFGTPLASNQALRFRYAALSAELGSLECLNRRCEGMLLDQANFTELAAAAKWRGGRLVRETSDFLLQVSGGRGYLEGHDADRAYRDGRAISIAGGTDEMMLEMIARMNGT